LTKSFLAQKSIQNGAPESSDEGEKEQLRVQVTISYCLYQRKQAISISFKVNVTFPIYNSLEKQIFLQTYINDLGQYSQNYKP